MKTDLQTRLYRALWQNKEIEEVIKLCKETPEGPFYRCTIYSGSVLHAAIYMKKYCLANELFDHLPNNLLSRLDGQNDWGETLLHDVATSNKGHALAKKLLQKAPGLLEVRNNWGETAVFQASRYGKCKTFNFLVNEVDRCCRLEQNYNYLQYFMRNDGTTILHMAILTRNFGMALMIAERYPELCDLQDTNGMTPLQMLACSPTAFKSGAERGSFLRELVYSSIGPGIEDEEEHEIGVIQKVISFILGMPWKPRCILPMLGAVKEVKRGHKRAERLANILIQYDTTWKNGPKPCPDITPQISDALSLTKAQEDLDLERPSTNNNRRIPDAKEIPFILAAKYGRAEIVKAILHEFPQTVEYLNYEQQTFLHVAIKNRNFKIFKLVNPEVSPIRGQLRAIDVKGNSILHMVGNSSKKSRNDTKMRSPVIRLSEDLQLLEILHARPLELARLA